MNLNRRQFHLASTALACHWLSLAPETVLAGLENSGQATEKLVELGLNALARSPERNYFNDGHRGASLISAYLLCHDNQLDDKAAARIVELFDAGWASSELCRAFPEADPVDDAIDQVGKALAENSGVLRQVGHDAIFAMHAIKGFHLNPRLATSQRVEGVCRLVRSFKPWRDEEPDPEIQIPSFADSQAASRFVLQEASDAVDRFQGYGQGFSGHMLTFGQSLIELADLGYEEWAESGRVAFQKYVTVTRQGPGPDAKQRAPHGVSQLRPDQAEYWQRRKEGSLGLGHVFKYPYAYYDLMARANSPQLREVWEAKAWRLF